MSVVRVGRNESIESALRRFKKACDREGILQEYKKHERYSKPSEIRHQQKIERRKKIEKMKRKLREQEEMEESIFIFDK